jgi:hypothetical protein
LTALIHAIRKNNARAAELLATYGAAKGTADAGSLGNEVRAQRCGRRCVFGAVLI